MNRMIMLAFLTFSLLMNGCTSKTEEKENSNSSTNTSQNEEKTNVASLLFVDSEKCEGSTLSVKNFEASCNPISETKINDSITVKAYQVIPKDKKDNDQLEVGETVRLEFYKDGEKLDVPEQDFHSFWATDFLSLGVAYKDEKSIYVYGTEKPGSPEFGYQYNGEVWKKVK